MAISEARTGNNLVLVWRLRRHFFVWGGAFTLRFRTTNAVVKKSDMTLMCPVIQYVIHIHIKKTFCRCQREIISTLEIVY